MVGSHGLLQQGLARHQAGDLVEACDLYRKVLDQRRDDADVLHLLGVATAGLGRTAEGISLIERAITIQPKFPAARSNLANLMMGRQDYEAAAGLFEEFLRDEPNNRSVLFNLALVRLAQARAKDALAVLDRLLRLAPLDVAAAMQRGALLNALGRPADAAADFSSVLRQHPDAVDALAGRGGAFWRLGMAEKATMDLDRALALDPEHVAALVNRGNILLDGWDHAAALALYERALARSLDDLAALINRGAALEALGRLEEALECHQRARALRPDHAEAAQNAGLCLLRMGDYARGWPLFEARLRRAPWVAALPTFTAPQWDGQTDLAGLRLLLVGEQGLGDTIQFSRFARLAAERGATVILGVEPPLRRLLAMAAGVSTVVVPADPQPDYDLFCPLMSLPARLGLTIDDVGLQAPYLAADPADVAGWRSGLSTLAGLKVGLAWSGDPRSDDPAACRIDRRRSIELAKLAPLLATAGVTFVSLQKGVASGQAADLPILDWTEDLEDFADTAALIAALDLVITVDTSVAHAAGALGRPVWVLNRFERCWRWMADRTDSPWYPTMRLFTQTRPGMWEDVVADVVAALDQLARGSVQAS